jgi:hypothetical protein
MNCEDIALILDDADLGKLDREVRLAVEDHLVGCPECDRVWSPHAHLAKSRTPALPPGFADQCAALVMTESLPSGKRRAHTRIFVLGCLVAGVAAAGILTMHLSERGAAEPIRSVSVAAPVFVPEPASASSVTVNETAAPSEVAPTTMSQVSPDLNPVGSAPSKSSADVCADRPERVSALPGVTGFKLPKYLISGQAAAALASEGRDPIWASDMERQISEALQNKDGLRLAREETVCRMTACGILLEYRPGADSVELHAQEALTDELRAGLQAALGFGGRGAATMDDRRCGGTRFTVIYLTRANGREQYGPPISSPLIPAFLTTPSSRVPVQDPLLTDLSGNIENMLSELLVAEPVVRSSWSLAMESDLKREASVVAGDRWSQILVECRVTACGVVLSSPRSEGQIESGKTTSHLASVLGRARGSSISTRTIASDNVVVIYLRDDRR